MKAGTIAVFFLFLAAGVSPVWASGQTFSGYGKKLFGKPDPQRMCTVRFSTEKFSADREVGLFFRFVNTGTAPVKGDPFSSAKTKIISKDGKTYEVPWYSGKVQLDDGRVFEIPGKASDVKVEHVVKEHPEARRPSAFEVLSSPTKMTEEELMPKTERLINPGGAVEQEFYTKDPVVCAVIVAGNVDHVVLESGMGKFILQKDVAGGKQA